MTDEEAERVHRLAMGVVDLMQDARSGQEAIIALATYMASLFSGVDEEKVRAVMRHFTETVVVGAQAGAEYDQEATYRH